SVLSILALSSFTTSSCSMETFLSSSPGGFRRAHQGSKIPGALNSSPDVPLCGQVEDDDRQIVVLAQRDGGRVHHVEVLLESMHVGERLVAPRRGIDLRIRACPAGHLGGLPSDRGLAL